jgi:hypothetical protein
VAVAALQGSVVVVVQEKSPHEKHKFHSPFMIFIMEEPYKYV